MSVQVHHSSAELARRKELAHARVKRLRSVSRHLSNSPIREEGSELDRVRRRRAGMVAKLQDLAVRAEESGDWDQDAARLAAALDAVLDSALAAFQRADTQQGIDLVVAATSTVDALLELLGGTDADDQGQSNAQLLTGATRSSQPAVPWQHPTSGYRSMGVRLLQRAEGDALPTRPVLEGDFAVFDEWTEINDMWEGTFLERIAPGAFAQTFKDDRDNMRVLFQHGRDAMLGSKVIGTIETLEETKTGAHYVAPLFRGLPELLLEGLAEPSQYGASFRFEPVQESWNDSPKLSEYNPRGIPERTLTEVRVAEFGPVTFPAYTSASAGLRSRSLTSKFGLVVPAGRPRAGSAGGGVTSGATARTVSQSDPSARDRELRLRGIIK